MEYGTQRISSEISRYNIDYHHLSARFEGLLKPPYSGIFNLLISGDDVVDFWFSKNRTVAGLVCYLPYFIKCVQ